MELTIRPIRREEFPLLADFLYDAIYRSDPSSPLPRQIIEHPSLRIYIADFGTLPDDRCLVAQAEGHVVGMVWVRCIRAYGYIGEGIPEFVLSVAAPCRGQGIGTRLMREMLQRLSAAGYPEASLSVQRRNPAVRLYRRLGFRTVKRTLEEYIMVCDLRQLPQDTFHPIGRGYYARPLYSKPNSSITFRISAASAVPSTATVPAVRSTSTAVTEGSSARFFSTLALQWLQLMPPTR